MASNTEPIVCKMDPLMFVKIQNNELCEKAVQQIKLAEEVKITKEKIKEVEEEWQNNLLNWKSKRRQSKNSSEDETAAALATARKTKTFSEILSEKAKSGHRIGYNLHQYLDGELDNDKDLKFNLDDSRNDDDDKSSDDSMNEDNNRRHMNNNNNNMNIINTNNKSNLGDVIVFDTSLLKEFSYKSNDRDRDDSSDSSIPDTTTTTTTTSNCQQNRNNSNKSFGGQQKDSCLGVNSNNDKHCYSDTNKSRDIDSNNEHKREERKTDKIRVEITDWKQQNSHNNKDNVLMYLLGQQQQQSDSQQQPKPDRKSHESVVDEEIINSSYDAEEDDEDDEELERIERLEQEKSFKAKLSVFESLAKSDAEVAALTNTSPNKSNVRNTNKSRDEPKHERQPSNEELSQRQAPPQPPTRDRPVVYGGGQRPQYANNDNSDDRIQQLHRERQMAQRPQQSAPNGHQYPQSQSLAGNVIYQSPNYNQKPVQQSSQISQQQHYEQQQYYVMDEPIGKQNSSTNASMVSPKPIRPQLSQQLPQQPPYNQSIQATLPQEHLYVNQKQLFNNQMPNHYEPVDSRPQRFGPTDPRDYYDSSQQHVSQTTQQLSQLSTADVGVPTQPVLTQHNNQPVPLDQTYPSANNQYLYYPKPYTSQQINSGQTAITAQTKPVMVSQQHKLPMNARAGGQPVAMKPQLKQQHQSGYNQNHWLLQEAELRRQLDSIPSQVSSPSTVSATQRTTTTVATPTSAQHKSSAPQKGMLSVSGKKKCSSCGDELGRGCAAMVVESLSLYYHINCFRCSVCNIQLGNGTVGTDVRVRNHKLHCQNCYSNDEAGLKFSRV